MYKSSCVEAADSDFSQHSDCSCYIHLNEIDACAFRRHWVLAARYHGLAWSPPQFKQISRPLSPGAAARRR